MFLDIALIHNNAKVGSQIACALSKQTNERKLKSKTHHHGKHSPEHQDIVSINTCDGYIIILAQHSTHNAVLLQVVIGGINVDFIAKGKTKTLHVSWIYIYSSTVLQIMWDHMMWVIMTSEKTLFQFGQTNPGSVCQSFGGVGRNIAGGFLSDYVCVRVFICSLNLIASFLSFKTLWVD